jgi:cell wall-associated NlpC family hydrolase
MHPDRSGSQRSNRRRRLATRLVASVLAVVSSAIVVAPLAPAQAVVPSRTVEIDRQSPAVVRQATEALWRYRRYTRLRTAVSLGHYNRARNEAARATAAALRVRPRVMVNRWVAASRRHQVAVLAALSQLGAPYEPYTSDPRVGFDCSGLTSWAWRRAGVTIPRSSGDQIAAAAPRRRATAHAGDLVYYPGHVSMYLGMADAIVHASDPQDDVELSFISRSVLWGNPTG